MVKTYIIGKIHDLPSSRLLNVLGLGFLFVLKGLFKAFLSATGLHDSFLSVEVLKGTTRSSKGQTALSIFM